MHGEIHKHQLTDDGEEKIYDTSEMAVCLGVVQNYTFTKTAGKSGGTIWKMMKKDKKEDEDEDAEWEAVAQDPSLLDGMMLTKQVHAATSAARSAVLFRMDGDAAMRAGRRASISVKRFRWRSLRFGLSPLSSVSASASVTDIALLNSCRKCTRGRTRSQHNR